MRDLDSSPGSVNEGAEGLSGGPWLHQRMVLLPGKSRGRRSPVGRSPRGRTESDTTERLATCLMGNLYAGQEATVRTGPGTTDWFKIGKGVRQGCILSACLFNFSAEYIM